MRKYEHINLSYIKDMAGDDTAFVIEMINDYKNTMPLYIDDLYKATSDHDRTNISFYAHKLSSSFMIMGAKDLADTAKSIELKAKSGAEFTDLESEVNRISPMFCEVVEELDMELKLLQTN